MVDKTLYSKIVEVLRSKSDNIQADKDKVYHKKGYKSYGLTIPQVKKTFKDFKLPIRNLDLKEKLNLADFLYESGYAEAGRIGNAVLASSVNEINPTHFASIDTLLDYFNNWDEVDDFCINVTQPLLKKHPKETLELLRKWNRSDNMWKRRASVVAFVRKVGEGGKYTKEVLTLCETLVGDQEDLVQKGAGWALKDAMRGNKEEVMDYVKSLRRRGVPSTITLYAIRDLNGRDRQAVIDVK